MGIKADSTFADVVLDTIADYVPSETDLESWVELKPATGDDVVTTEIGLFGADLTTFNENCAVASDDCDVADFEKYSGWAIGIKWTAADAEPVDPCFINPAAPGCPMDPCIVNPAAAGCGDPDCANDPSAAGCEPDCAADPTATGCPCDLDPTAPGCPNDPCVIDNTASGCPGDCNSFPDADGCTITRLRQAADD